MRHGPQTGRPWEISIPGRAQTLKPNATPLPVPNTSRHQAQVLVQPLMDIKPPKGSPGAKAPLAEPPNLSNEWSPDLFWIHLGPQSQHKISGRTPPTRDALGKRKRKRRGGEKALIARICAR